MIKLLKKFMDSRFKKSHVLAFYVTLLTVFSVLTFYWFGWKLFVLFFIFNFLRNFDVIYIADKQILQYEKECDIENWYNENAPYGRSLGYPECCINEFCEQPPSVMRGNATDDDRLRYDASLIDGDYSGFIPCKRHARQILDGKIKLADLIKDRSPEFPPFPNLD